jgi:hypothetical protein
VARYLSQLDTADRQEPTEALAAKATRLKEKLAKLKEEMAKLAAYEKQMLASSDQQISPGRLRSALVTLEYTPDPFRHRQGLAISRLSACLSWRSRQDLNL